MEATTAPLVGGSYEQSFGFLPNKSCYHEGGILIPHANPTISDEAKSIGYLSPSMKILKEKIEAGVKALGTTTSNAGRAGTAGVAMVPIYVDPIITDQSRKYTPLREMFPRVSNQGLTADFNVITAKGGAITAAEDPTLTTSDDTYDRSSVSMKYVYIKGRVTGQAIAAYPSYTLAGWQSQGSGLAGSTFSPQPAPNAKQLEVRAKARSMMEKEESLIVNGDTSTDSTQYNGIVQTQSTTNKVTASAALKYDHLEECAQNAVDDSGRPNLGLCDTNTMRQLRGIMIDTYNYRPADMRMELPFGVTSHLMLETMSGVMPVLYSQYLSTTSGSRSFYMLDMNVWEMRVLQDMTYEELAQTGDAKPFMLKMYEALICRSTPFNSFVGDIN